MPFVQNDQKFILLSACLHVLAALFVGWTWSQNSTPLGIHRQGSTVIEFSVPAFSKPVAVAPKPAVTKSQDDGPTIQATPAVATAPATSENTNEQQLGFADGVASQGPLGQADGKANSEKDRYLYELRVLIEQKKIYPQISKRLRETGRVVVRFQVLKDGRIEAVDVKSASSYARLNEAALGLVRSIEKFRPLPQTVSNDQLSLEIPIEYVLN